MYDAACERGGQSNTTAHGCATGGRDDSTLVTHVKRDTTQGRLAGAVATLPSPWTGTQTGGVGPREYGSRAVVRIGVSGKRVNRAYCRGGRRASTLYKCRADASSRIVLGCTHTRPCAQERPGRPLRRALAGTQRPAPDWPSAEGGLGAAVWGCRLRAARGGDDCPSAVETTVTRWWNGRARCAPRARPHGAGLAMGEPTHHRRRTSIGSSESVVHPTKAERRHSLWNDATRFDNVFISLLQRRPNEPCFRRRHVTPPDNRHV